ncbi:MAG: hypothetical protein JW969_20685 [Spirochaetales bacterium]|nr:hypothetical protein [Spirochaetales bacterium]
MKPLTKIYRYLLILVFPVIIAMNVSAEDAIPLDKAVDDMLKLVEEKFASIDENSVKTMAIYHFTEKDAVTPLGEYVASEMATGFSRTGNKGLKIISRKKMDDILAEYQFQLTEMTDQSKSVKIGQLLNADYIISGYIFSASDSFRLNVQMIDIKTAEIVIGNSYSIVLDEFMANLSKDEIKTATEENGAPPQFEYVLTDSFDNLDDLLWVKMSVNKDLEVQAKNGRLSLTGKFRKGRLNSINTITSRPFKVKSFAVEISFRDPLLSCQAVSFQVQNTKAPFFGSGALSMTANVQKEYYKFSWYDGRDWKTDDDKLRDELFGDEDKKFHRLKLVYDLETKTAYGYVDDILINVVKDFTFVRSDKIQVEITIRETVSDTGKDVHVELDDFKSSVDF